MSVRDLAGSLAPTALSVWCVGIAAYNYISRGHDLWYIAIIFMPMSFFLVGVAFYQMSRKLRELQLEVETLRQAAKVPHDVV